MGKINKMDGSWENEWEMSYSNIKKQYKMMG
jgi:hypothetical protein